MAKDLIHETTATTGTGSFTLAAENGKVRFSDSTYGYGTGGTSVFWYFASSRTTSEWEVGTGHMSDANTLVRDAVLHSSNANAKVSFSAGTKDVCDDIPGQYQIVNPLTTQGDLLTRSSSAMTRLALGTNGQKLITDGNDPLWGGGAVQLAAISPSGVTTSAITTIPASYSGLMIVLRNIGWSGGSNYPRIYGSINNGSSYDTTNSNYTDYNGSSSVAGFLNNQTATSSTQSSNAVVIIHGYQNGACFYTWKGANALSTSATTLGTFTISMSYNANFGTSPINALRLDGSSGGTFNKGTWTLYGLV